MASRPRSHVRAWRNVASTAVPWTRPCMRCPRAPRVVPSNIVVPRQAIGYRLADSSQRMEVSCTRAPIVPIIEGPQAVVVLATPVKVASKNGRAATSATAEPEGDHEQKEAQDERQRPPCVKDGQDRRGKRCRPVQQAPQQREPPWACWQQDRQVVDDTHDGDCESENSS